MSKTKSKKESKDKGIKQQDAQSLLEKLYSNTVMVKEDLEFR